MVKIPSGDIVDVTDSGFTPCGIVTRRRNLHEKIKKMLEINQTKHNAVF